jgi:hypothetical protein
MFGRNGQRQVWVSLLDKFWLKCDLTLNSLTKVKILTYLSCVGMSDNAERRYEPERV